MFSPGQRFASCATCRNRFTLLPAKQMPRNRLECQRSNHLFHHGFAALISVVFTGKKPAPRYCSDWRISALTVDPVADLCQLV